MQKERAVHSAVQIYLWICLTLATQILHGYTLLLLFGALLVLLVKAGYTRFFYLLRRTRWILFSILVIYAYATPGHALWPQLGMYSPVREGMEDGLLQLLRLLTVLAGLSILLTLLSQKQLITGLYTLSLPLARCGLARERIAVRLALTLYYAESVTQHTILDWRGNVEHLLTPVPVVTGDIELYMAPLKRLDWLLAAAASVTLIGLWI